MVAQGSRSTAVLLALTAGLVAIASGIGIALRGDLATVPFTTVRGDVVEVLSDGVYRFNGQAIGAEGIGWDLVTFFLVVPALAVAIPGVGRGALRSSLFATGILVYLLYQYGEYATFLAYGPLFIVYAGIVALSVGGLGLLIGRLDLATLAERTNETFPRRGVVGFGLYMAILLAILWLPLLGRTLTATQVPELAGGTTLVVQAFDLGLLVPLGLFTAWTTWRRLPVGVLLASIVVVKGAAMGLGIAAMLLVEAVATEVVQPIPIALFLATALVSGLLGRRVYGSIGGREQVEGRVRVGPSAASRRPAT
jgi:hypothetical protein